MAGHSCVAKSTITSSTYPERNPYHDMCTFVMSRHSVNLLSQGCTLMTEEGAAYSEGDLHLVRVLSLHGRVSDAGLNFHPTGV